MMLFKQKAIGDDIEGFMKEYNLKLKDKYQLVRNENESEGSKQCMQFIQTEFLTIDKKLKNNEYNIFQDYERDVNLFQQFYMENAPKSVNKDMIILEFL